MSFTIDEREATRPLVIPKTKKGWGDIIYIKDKMKEHAIVKRQAVDHIALKSGTFQLYPCGDYRIIYICGSSGSGKSIWAANYIRLHLELYPKSKFYIFSRVDYDEPLDALKPRRVVLDDSIIDNPFEIDEIPNNSICLFDDVDVISDDAIKKVVYNIKDQITNMGRHKNISCLATSHLINGNDRKTTRTVLNEAQAVVIFPQMGSCYGIKYYLKNYFGLSPREAKYVLKTESRWVCLLTRAPQIMVTENECIFIKALSDYLDHQ